MKRTTLDVLYSQVAVFDTHLELPFNDWTDVHVAQGFAWRHGSVSFMTLDDGGVMDVEVLIAGNRPRDRGGLPDPSPERCIVVPFHVPVHGQCVVATAIDSIPLELAPGEYALTFEHGRWPSGEMWMVLRFDPVSTPVRARVVIADSDLNPPDELVMTALPA